MRFSQCTHTHTHPHTFAFDYISLRINVARFSNVCLRYIRTCEYFSFSFDRKTIDYTEHFTENRLLLTGEFSGKLHAIKSLTKYLWGIERQFIQLMREGARDTFGVYCFSHSNHCVTN